MPVAFRICSACCWADAVGRKDNANTINIRFRKRDVCVFTNAGPFRQMVLLNFGFFIYAALEGS